MVGGADLIMTGLAVALAAVLMTERARRAARPADLAQSIVKWSGPW
jgi:hypothetical protein